MSRLPEYSLICTRRKTIALIVKPDGALIVRAPLKASKRQVEEIISSKADWIRLHQEAARNSYAPPAPHAYQVGEAFLFLGRSYPLEIVPAQNHGLRFQNRFYLAQSALNKAEKVFTDWYREQARALFTARVSVYATKYSFSPRQVRLSSARTRWGSCSSKGYINLNWRLIMAPIAVIDYVVLHELVHLQIKNHSRQYWQTLASLLPGYKVQRDWLKKNGHTLDLNFCR